MKRILGFLAMSLLINMSSAQITINEDQLPQIGDSVVYQNAANAGNVAIGPAGPNQVWDFSMLTPDATITQYIVSPDVDSSSVLFPTATIAMQDEFGQTTQFGEVTDTEFWGLGLTSNNFLGFAVEIVLDPPQKLIELPTNYEDTYISPYSFSLGISNPTPDFDTARVSSISVDTVTYDAYGVLMLPNGDFDVLRRETRTSSILSVEVFLGFFWLPFIQDTTYSVSYSFMAREAKRELATVTLDSLNENVESIAWQDLDPLLPTAPIAMFEYADTAATPGLVHFMDLSSNNPTDWLWNFGDGTTSIEQHPQHIYSSDNAFEVCLTASNTGGSDQYCQTLDVNVSTQTPTWNPEWILAPNPSTGVFRLNIKDHSVEELSASIFSPTGQLILQKELGADYSFDISAYPSGTYILVLHSGKNKIGATEIQVLK